MRDYTYKERFLDLLKADLGVELISGDDYDWQRAKMPDVTELDWWEAPIFDDRFWFWPTRRYDDHPDGVGAARNLNDDIFFVVLYYQTDGDMSRRKEMIGAFRVRDDKFYYGSSLRGGNHDWSLWELRESFRNTIESLRKGWIKPRKKASADEIAEIVSNDLGAIAGRCNDAGRVEAQPDSPGQGSQDSAAADTDESRNSE